jgi:hypothetical protein
MADSKKHTALTAEIATLREQQSKDSSDAVFLGWNPQSVATHEKRKLKIDELLRHLENLHIKLSP